MAMRSFDHPSKISVAGGGNPCPGIRPDRFKFTIAFGGVTLINPNFCLLQTNFKSTYIHKNDSKPI